MPETFRSRILIHPLEIKQYNMPFEEMLLVCFKKQLRSAATAGVNIGDIKITVEPYHFPTVEERYIRVTLEGETSHDLS